MIPFHYRSGKPEDAENIQSLTLKAYQEFAGVLTPDNWIKMRTNLMDQEGLSFLMQKGSTIICETAGMLAGVIFVVPSGHPTAIYQENWAYIRRLGVDPAYRGAGIGRQLVIQAIEHAKAAGETVLALHTSEIMPGAQRLYSTLGFACTRELDPILGVKYWLYQLVL